MFHNFQILIHIFRSLQTLHRDNKICLCFKWEKKSVALLERCNTYVRNFDSMDNKTIYYRTNLYIGYPVYCYLLGLGTELLRNY